MSETDLLNDECVLRLSIFAFHVQLIERMEDGEQIELCPCEGCRMRVRRSDEFTYYVNGVWVGNSYGAVHAFTELVLLALAKAAVHNSID